MPHAVTRLVLTRFRNYGSASLSLDADHPFICLTGVNGAGKTNVLEAVSMLAPGRGLRGSAARDMMQQGQTVPEGWAVAARLDLNGTERKAGTGLENLETGRRIIRIDGDTQSNSSALGEDWSILWLTPQMDRLFAEGPSARRRFLDRLTLALYPDHGSQVAAYEKAMRERNRMLSEGMADPTWFKLVEGRIATHGVAVAAARADMVAALQAESDGGDEALGFVAADIALDGDIEAALTAGDKASDCEDLFQEALAQNREDDRRTGRQALGPHRSDLKVTYRAKNMAAELSSTGEQKALLTSLLLAQSRLIKRLRGSAPILLLDEAAAHLDKARRNALFSVLESLETQVWITGTDPEIFSPLRSNGLFYQVADGSLQPQPAPG